MAVPRAVYRLLHRRLQKPITILPPLDHVSSPNWGSYRTFNLSVDTVRQTNFLNELNPPLPYPADSSTLMSQLRSEFRNRDKDKEEVDNECLDALVLSDYLLSISAQTSTVTSNNVTVQLTSHYLHENLSTQKSIHQYRVRLINNSSDRIKILGRSWEIKEDDDMITKVNQPTSGVVGQFPVLKPERIFEYSSGCEIRGGVGGISGKLYYAILKDDEDGEGEVDYKNVEVEEIEVGEVELRRENEDSYYVDELDLDDHF
ncbi:hypothetical protein TrLO_g2578 [Triparma laevis f. longispina]|uniref:ApaG domain-containing protein n=1 Tax=Triparma laevis f. longispina TaxID=1714387 RepID=A0A9W6ZSP8_9STRA|nr:hypothetical protein TrLO_g2578 [Triparma laevis f. longispina]